MNDGFSDGFWTGFVAAGILGFLIQRMHLAVKRAGSPGQPQKVSQSTGKTPFQVMGDAMKAMVSFLAYGVLLVVAVSVVYFLLTGNSVF